MVTPTIKELEAARSKVAELEAAVAKSREALLSLPEKFGFSNVDDFVAAVKEAVGNSSRSKIGKSASAAVSTEGTKKGKRAKITPAIKQELKALAGQGKTGVAIAKALGISLPSVQNIKRELGLTKKIKK